MTRPVLLEPVDGSDLADALRRALAGGPPVAPLPAEPTERRRALAMLSPAAPVNETDVAAIVSTSGSTGAPKGVVLSRSAMTASADATHARLQGPGDWALVLPVHYVAGLMVVARALVAGTQVHPGASDLADLGAIADAMTGPRYLSVVPTQLVRGLTRPTTTEALARFDSVLLGGAAADPALLARARAAGVKVVTTYGMSETCGGCVYDGVPLDGTSLTLEAGSDRIRLGGATLFSGYRLRPDLTADVLSPDRSDRILLTADRGRLTDGRLEVLGRVDDVVVSGGMNVDLAAVERAAVSWPTAGDLAVLGVADAEWGMRVVAVSDTSDDLVGLRTHLAELLPAYAAPRTLLHLNALPRTSSGKIDRQQLIRVVTEQLTAEHLRTPNQPVPNQPVPNQPGGEHREDIA